MASTLTTFDAAEEQQHEQDDTEFELPTTQQQTTSSDNNKRPSSASNAAATISNNNNNNTNSSTATTAAATTSSQQLVFSGQMEEQRRVYDFMTEHDIPKFVDKICHHLLRTTPSDPVSSVISMLTGQKNGMHHGGAAIAGHNVHGGWIRCFSPDGTLLSSINHLKSLPCCTHELLNNQTVDQGLAADNPGQPTPAVNTSGSALSGPSAIGTSLMACALGERAIYVICSPPEGSSQTLIDLPSNTGGGIGGGSGGGSGSAAGSSAGSSGVMHFVCKCCGIN